MPPLRVRPERTTPRFSSRSRYAAIVFSPEKRYCLRLDRSQVDSAGTRAPRNMRPVAKSRYSPTASAAESQYGFSVFGMLVIFAPYRLFFRLCPHFVSAGGLFAPGGTRNRRGHSSSCGNFFLLFPHIPYSVGALNPTDDRSVG